MNSVFERLHAPTEAKLQQLRAIYEANFPPDKRKSFEVISAGITSETYTCVVARNPDGYAILALAFLLILPDNETAFLEYIAVDQAFHSQGIGSGLLRFIIGGNGRLVWEVEPPVNDNPEDENNRRIRFYERLGGQIIELSTGYMMPNFESGGGVPLLLMQAPLERRPGNSEVTALVHGIYDVAYPEWSDLRDTICRDLESLLAD